jgi:hypothetical protein
MTKTTIGNIIAIVLVAVVSVLAVFGYDTVVIQPRASSQPGALSRGTGYGVPCYMEQGGVGLTCETGGAVTIGSGAGLTVAAGATAVVAGPLAIGGGYGDTGCTITAAGALSCNGVTTIGNNLVVTGAITGGSFSPTTFSNAADLTADTGNFTTTLTKAGTAVARVSGDNINGATLKEAGTPVARLAGSNIDAGTLKVGGTAVARLSGSTVDTAALSVVGTPVALQIGALAASNVITCNTATITGTGVLATGLATPSAVTLSLGQDVTGDCARLSFTNATGVVTAKCWTAALTPVAAATPAVVQWCALGKP